MAVTFVDQVAARASQINPQRALLTVVVAPFYALGLLVGVLWVAILWAFAAVQEGVADARERADRRRGST